MTSGKFTFAPGTKPLTGFTIKRGIQRGGFGEVYYALSDGGKEVALKLLHSHVEIERRGTELCLNLKHQNLVSIIDIRQDEDDDTWIVMEYVSGKTLDRILTDDFPNGMPVDDARSWLAGLAAGVDYLHDKGIVHRDLKPQNLYREHGQVKIGDIGLSKIITPSQRGAQTESIGTIYYMAPEISRGEYGPEIDVYSSAVILYELLTGYVPFAGETTAEILNRHLTDQPDLNPLPPRLRPVLQHALAKDAAQRTPSLGEFLAEFDAALDGQTINIPTAPAPQPAPQPAPTLPGLVVSEQQVHSRPGKPPRRRTQVYFPADHLGPLAHRNIPLSQRGLEASAGMAAAILFTALLAASGQWTGLFNDSHSATPLTAVAYGLTTLLAAWALLVGTKAWEGTGRESLSWRRLSLLLLGGGVGATGWWLHQVLLVDLPPLAASQTAGLVDSIGSMELVQNNQPTLTGYVMFFGLLFGIRRWWWHTDGFRPKRLRVLSLLLTTSVSALLGLVLQFPLSAAIGWGLGIAIVVQLSAPWIAPELRQARLQEEGATHA
jgi:hypothetical protein